MLFDFQVAQKNACRRWWEQLRGAKEKKNTTTPRNFFIFIKRTNLIRKNADKRSLRSFPLVLTTTESAEKEKNEKKLLCLRKTCLVPSMPFQCRLLGFLVVIHPWCLYKRDVRFSFHSHFLSFVVVVGCNHKKGLEEQYAELGIAKHRQPGSSR